MTGVWNACQYKRDDQKCWPDFTCKKDEEMQPVAR